MRILLSGQPRTGKTWIAREIASALQMAGFEVRVGQHVDEAGRALFDRGRRG
ncbi:AAA family ATPase [Mesorhizobium sp.]|uniref:AAA family ATPase n=1 Tax=Mesorhizobium sp. TaxID=1871066 RepID=UPI00121F9AC8|nr:MAG: AAA family ATPase [Mesorhizobium sp.]TIQ53344.1 MAG: AAA family ATPase [Mesorhizobium sp.]